jgi:hypothetical protein
VRAPALPVAPATFTDRTCESVTGSPWRGVRDWCREHGVAIHHVGRRPTVVVADYLRALAGEPVDELPSWDEDEVIARAAGVRS